MTTQVKTTCPYCGVGCGVIATVNAAGRVEVQGDKEHPANLGRLCSKGTALAETLDLDGRLLHPEVEGKRVDWDTALDRVATRFKQVIAEHGPDAVAFYVSGQLLTEDYYVANKLMKGYIGSANIDTNSRLCMSSSVAGHKRAFGADAVPCSYEDLERARLIVLTGSNTAWCHPVLFQRIVQAKKDNDDLRVVVIDPRATATATVDVADLHLALQPGTDTLLFNGLLVYLQERGEGDEHFIAQHTEGVEAALMQARAVAPDLASVAAGCGLPVEPVERFYRLFARTERVVTVYSQGVNQWAHGTDKVNSIINCHLYSGRIGRPGMGPFSFTGQPNAMGGREVGGLANQLAAHMGLDNPAERDLVQRFWGAPVIADHEGYKAVEMFRQMEAGRVKALWVMATNPAVSLPDADRVRAALEKCEFVVVSDCMAHTDTTAYADVLLPALAWGEKDGTVTNSERRISRQRPFLSAPGEARPDWWAIAQVAQRMGHAEAFDYATVDQVFREHAALSGFENRGQRDFDISHLQSVTASDYASLPPLQWPLRAGEGKGTARLFGDGRFYTANGRARFIAVGERRPAHATDSDYPLVLNTGRIRDQWHTMTRTGKTARLFRHIYEPYAELHPEDGVRYGVDNGALVRVTSQWGEVIVRCKWSDSQRRGSVFVPMHWNDQYAHHAYIDAVVNPATDPISGQPEFKHTPVAIATYRPAWHGFLLSRRQLPMTMGSYWSLSRGDGVWRYELAGEQAVKDWATAARALLCAKDDQVQWIELMDASAMRYRGARLTGERLESCIFIGPSQQLPPREWLMELFQSEHLDDQARRSLLLGQAHTGAAPGRNVCACFGVSEAQVIKAIEENDIQTVEQVSARLKAGTNCGSCLPEISKLLHKVAGTVTV